MKNTSKLQILLSTILLTFTARAEPRFEGVVSSSTGEQFLISEEVSDNGKIGRVVSPFLKLGQSFRGWAIKEYDEKHETLVVAAGNQVIKMHLKDATVSKLANEQRATDTTSKPYLEKAQAIADAGNSRMKTKLEGLRVLAKETERAKSAIDSSEENLATLKKKYGTEGKSGQDYNRLSDRIEGLKKRYLQMAQKYVDLEQQIAQEVK